MIGLLLAGTAYPATYRHSDDGRSTVIFSIPKAKCASYYVRPVMAISPTKVVVDGVEVLPHEIITWHVSAEQAPQKEDTVLLLGSLRSLVFYKEGVDEKKSPYITYVLPDDAKVVEITYRPRYPDDTFGKKVTVVVTKDEDRKETISTSSAEEVEEMLKAIEEKHRPGRTNVAPASRTEGQQDEASQVATDPKLP